MRGIRHQGMAAEMFCENALAGGDGFFLRHLAEAEFFPRLLRTFDDEGRRVGVELVGMRPHPAVLGFLEDEGEGIVEFLVGAKPDELAFPDIDIRLEEFRQRRARPGIHAIRRDDQVVGIHVELRFAGFRFEDELDAEFPRPLLQQDQQLFAADAAKAVTGGNRAHSLVDDRDVVPIGEMFADPVGADRIVGG